MTFKQPTHHVPLGGMVHTDIGMFFAPMTTADQPLVVELTPTGNGTHFCVPTDFGNGVPAAVPDLYQAGRPIMVGLSDPTQATGEGVDQCVQIPSSGPDTLNQIPKAQVPGAAAPTPNFQYLSLVMYVPQRNPDGSVKRDDQGRPLVALDSAGNPMIGPLLLEWVPDIVQVQSAGKGLGAVSGYIAAGEPMTGLLSGGFVAGGGGGGDSTCAVSLNNFGVKYG